MKLLVFVVDVQGFQLFFACHQPHLLAAGFAHANMVGMIRDIDTCGASHPQLTSRRTGGPVKAKTQILIYLIGLGLADALIPIPITAMLLIMVLYQRPQWFREFVREIYGS